MKTKLRKQFDSLSKKERDVISKEIEDIFVFEIQKEIDNEFLTKLHEKQEFLNKCKKDSGLLENE
jgi:hypothetical protein